MFEITLITVGKLKEKFYITAAAEYEKRLRGYCNFKIIELPESRLPDNPSQTEINSGLEKEADCILEMLINSSFTAAFLSISDNLIEEASVSAFADILDNCREEPESVVCTV